MTDHDYYVLPSSPTVKVLDRFSLLDPSPQITDEAEDLSDPTTPFWPLLRHLLTTPELKPTTFRALTSLLDTISVTLRDTAHLAGDYALLREAIAARFQRHTQPHPGQLDHAPEVRDDDPGGERRFFAAIWPRLVELALEMPVLFPSARLPILGRGGTMEVALSRRQVGCLVVHMFLRTLLAPGWKEETEGLHDFGVWYGSEGQRQVGAVRAYLGGVMAYFEEVVCGDRGGVVDDEWVVKYMLRSLEEEKFKGLLKKPGCLLGDVQVEVVERFDLSPASLGVPGGAAVVSANKYIGFGQSATQEEVHVGSSPEACPAVLLTPPLGDDEVLIVRGAQAMVNIAGQRRDIRVEQMPVPDDGMTAWQDRTMLFMDALELDIAESGDRLPDLLPGNLCREIRKAYTAFETDGIEEIRTGLWGCGAFCGDPGIKMLILWLAASIVGVRLVVLSDTAGRSFVEDFRAVMKKARGVVRDTAGLWQLLGQAPASLARGATLGWIIQQLELGQDSVDQ